MGTAIKHPVPDWVKPSFVIFVIWALLTLSATLSAGCQKLQVMANRPVWHRMLYSCTHMATVGVKGLTQKRRSVNVRLKSGGTQQYKHELFLLFLNCSVSSMK